MAVAQEIHPSNPLTRHGAGDATAPDLHSIPLPEFVTPEWLGKQYHLTPKDMRRLSGLLAEHYADWPAERLDRTPEQFFVEIHRLAQKWPYVFADLSRMIEAILAGRKSYSLTWTENSKKPPPIRKLRRKCMIWNRLVGISSSYPEGEDEALVHGSKGSVGGESFFDTVQTLIEKASGPEKSELCWIMNFLRLTSTFWGTEPEIDARVRLWVRKVDCSDHIWPFRHLLGKLLTTPMGPVLSTLLEEARKEANRLEQRANSMLSEIKARFLELDDARIVVEDGPLDDYYEMEEMIGFAATLHDAASHVLADARASELHQMLAREMEGLLRNGTPGEEEELGARLDELDLGGSPPGCFPDPEWEQCLEQVAAFGSFSDRARELQKAAKAAAETYTQNDASENFDALMAAMSAARERLPVGPLFDALDAIEVIVLGLREREGDWEAAREGLLKIASIWARDSEAGKDTPDLVDAKLLEHEKKRHTETSEQLARTVEELERMREAAESDRQHLDEELSRAKAEIYRVTALLGKAGAVAGTGENVSTANGMTVPLPEEVSYDGLPDWAAQHFNGRVTLHPRALRALEDAQFDDIELAYRSVELLGTRYWQMRTRSQDTDGPRREYAAALEHLFLEDTPSASESAMGLARDSFELQWNERRLTMDRHLKNRARGRDPKRCFRLYFTWDDASRSVVIGHLPGHLRTRTS